MLAVVIYGIAFCDLAKEGIVAKDASDFHAEGRGWVSAVCILDVFVQY